MLIEHTRHKESERKLVDFINRANAKEETPLMIAALREREKMVEIFLKNGADVHVRNEKGYTAAHNACLKVSSSILGLARKNYMVFCYPHSFRATFPS